MLLVFILFVCWKLSAPWWVYVFGIIGWLLIPRKSREGGYKMTYHKGK